VTQLLVSEQSMATLKDAYRMRQFIIGLVGVDQSAARDPHSQSQTINEVTSGSQRRRRRLVAAAGPSAGLWQQTRRHVFGLTTAPDRCRIFASGDDSLPSDDRI